MKTDELMNGKMGCKCSKNYSVVILGVWRTNEEEDMISVLKELVRYMHGNRKQDRTRNGQAVKLYGGGSWGRVQCSGRLSAILFVVVVL